MPTQHPATSPVGTAQSRRALGRRPRPPQRRPSARAHDPLQAHEPHKRTTPTSARPRALRCVLPTSPHPAGRLDHRAPPAGPAPDRPRTDRRMGMLTPHAPWLPPQVAARPTAASRSRPTPHTHSPAVFLPRTHPTASRQPHAAPPPGGGARRVRAASHELAVRHDALAPLRRPTTLWDVWKRPWAPGLDCTDHRGLSGPHRPTPNRHGAVPPGRHLHGGRTRRLRPPVRYPPVSPPRMYSTRRPAIVRPTGLSGPAQHLGCCRGPPAASSPRCSEPSGRGGSPAGPSQPTTEGRRCQIYRRRNDGSAGGGAKARRISREVNASKDAVSNLRLEGPNMGITGALMALRGSCAGELPFVVRQPQIHRASR